MAADLARSVRAPAAVLAFALAIASGSGPIAAADPPPAPYGGKLAKAVFMSDTVADAIGALGPSGPAALRPLLADAAGRARQTDPALTTPAGSNPAVAARFERRRVLAQGMVALMPSAEARAESVAASEALLPSGVAPVEDAMGVGVPLAQAELAEGYLKAHRDTALAPYLYGYLMVQYRLAFERQAAAQALAGQKTSARKYRSFLLRAREVADPLAKALTEDIDGPFYLERPTPEHPRDFDPDACCRNR